MATKASKANSMKTKADTSAKRKAQAVTGPVAQASKAVKVVKVEGVNVALPLCLCGCGSTVKRAGSRFLQGHDAALKGYLQRHYLSSPRPTDPTLAHLAANFEAVTGETVQPRAEEILVAVNPAWRQFLDSAQMRTKAEKLANRATKAATAMVTKTAKVAKSGGSKVAAVANAASKEVRRMIGNFIKTGTVEGGLFEFVNGAGNTVSIPLGKTKAAPSA